ncbi:hypothetical protein [Polynucleobacter sphagniphilus]|nr:hypothetical protein [Polynucleobacter sphagniphilus]
MLDQKVSFHAGCLRVEDEKVHHCASKGLYEGASSQNIRNPSQ